MLLPSLSSHGMVVLWTELAALLVLARLLGALARRIGQPAVVGELLAGLLVGPSVLGAVSPAALHWFLPAGHAQGDLLTTVGQLSLLVLLVVVGAETDLPLIRTLGPAAATVSATSLVLPLGAGLAAAALLPAGFRSGHHEAAFVLLVAGAVGVSSLPVVAKIMADMGLLRRNFAQLALAAGTANDMVGFLLVTAATGLTGTGSQAQLAVALGGLVVALVVVFTVGQWAIDAVLRQVRRQGPNVAGSLTVALVAAFAAAAATQAVGLEGALGGFLAGIALGRSRFQQGEAMEQLTRFTNAVLAPLFFATAGLRVDLATLDRGAVLLATAVLVVGSLVVKFASGVLGARLAGLSRRDGTALGVALNGRGTLQVIIAGAGLAAGIFTTAAYSAVIVLAIVSSLSVAPLLDLVLGDWRGSAEEQARLEEEERLEANVVVRNERLLLATGGSPSSMVAAAVIHRAWPEQQPATVLAVGRQDSSTAASARAAAWLFPHRQVELTPVTEGDVLQNVLAETRLGYGVLGLGAADLPGPERLLSSVVDDIVTRCPIPMVVARRARRTDGRARQRGSAAADDVGFRSVLVPVAGTAASHAAQEVAYGVAAAQRSSVTLVHVVPRERRAPSAAGRPSDRAGEGVLADAARFAQRHGVRARGRTRRGTTPGEEIVRTATEIGADLIVLGAVARSLDGRPFLGHTVEHVLAEARAAVVVVVLPAEVPTEAAGPDDEDVVSPGDVRETAEGVDPLEHPSATGPPAGPGALVPSPRC